MAFEELADLQLKVQTAEEKLVRYQKDHSILGVDEKQNIVTAKLDELNKELTAAQMDRIQKEADYKLAMAADPPHSRKRLRKARAFCSTSCVRKKLSSLPSTHRLQPSSVRVIPRLLN